MSNLVKLPAGWEWSTLGDVGIYHNGRAFKPKEWSKKGRPILRIQDLTKTNRGEYNRFDGKVDEKNIVRRGDILTSWSATLGVFIWEGPEAALNQHIFKVESHIHGKYHYYAVKFVLEQLKNQTHGSGMTHITKGKFEATQIPLPPLVEQKRIAQILDKAQEIIMKKEEQIYKYEELALSIYNAMFGFPIGNNKWEHKKLAQISQWRSGGTPSRKKKQYFIGSIPWYTSGELNQMYVSDSIENISEEALRESSTKLIESGSLLLGMYDTAALKSSITTLEKSACNQAIAFSKINKEDANTLYIYYTIQIGKEHFKRLQRGIRQKNLSVGMIKDLEIPFPPLQLQNRFADIIKKHHLLNEKNKISLNYLKVNYQSLLQSAFKGELTKEKVR